MAAPSPFHIADLRNDSEELRGKISELADEIRVLKKTQFSQGVLLQTLQHNLREQSHGSPTAAIDSITVKSARHATTDDVLATSRSVSAQSNKEVNSIARLASSMRPESPAFVPSSITTVPSTKAPVNVFLPSLDHSIHALAPFSVHVAKGSNSPSKASQDCSADLKFSPVMQNIENGRPVLIGAANQSTKLDFGSSRHTLTPLIPLPNGGQQCLLESCQSTAEGFVKSKSEVISQSHGQFAPLTSSNYGNAQTSSPLPCSNSSISRADLSPLHILDTPLDQAPYAHHGLQPIKQAVLSPSPHIQPKSIAAPVISDRYYGATSGCETMANVWIEPWTTLGNEKTTTVREKSAATESVGTVDNRPEAPIPSFTRVLGSALDPESRLLVLKKSSSPLKYPWTGRQSIDLRFSAVLIKLTLQNGKAMSFGILGQSSMKNAGTRLILVREETGATGLKLAAKVFPAGKDPLALSTAKGSPFLAFVVKFNFPGKINTESITLSSYPVAKSSTVPSMIREIEVLRDPITKEIPADIHRITFTYSEKDIDIVQLNSLNREGRENHLQWDAETLKLFDFMALLRESSSKTINITFMNREKSNSEDLVGEWFRSVRENCGQAKDVSWDDGQGFSWERIEDADRNKRWRLKLRSPETQDASQS